MSGSDPRITRRAMLGSAAAAGAGLVLGPVAGAAGSDPAAIDPVRSAHSPRVFSAWVGPLHGQSALIHPGRAFALAGLQWSAPASARIELRTRRPDGTWGPWAQASVTGHDADPRREAGRSAGVFGEPAWVGESDAIALRSAGQVAGVRVHFVASQPTASPLAEAAALPLASPVLDAGPGQPPIIARSAWARDHAPPAGPANYGAIKLAFVHHTVNPNGYGPGEVSAMLVAIFDYHRYVRGFFDIAYNFIVDAFGRTWEARAGGIDEPVVGAHAGAYNEQSTGVAVLGTFASVVPPGPAIDALERLLAWKLALHGIPSLGKVTVVVDPADAFYTPFRPGQHVSLPRVAGHRDGDLTDCPGSAFYQALPRIRPRIADLEGVPAMLTLAVPHETVAPATQLPLTGSLALLSGAPIAGAPIEVQTLANDQATTIATATTVADGSWTATVPVSRNTVLRALHSVAPASTSNVIEVGVAPVLTLVLVSSSPLRVSGTINPPKPAVTLHIYRLRASGHRHLIHSKRVSAFNGQFSARVLIGARPGNYVVIARTREAAARWRARRRHCA